MACVVSMLLLLPLVVTGGQRVWGQIRIPGVQSGDEPHYLIMIHSLIRDYDLDLANNYRDAHRGAPDAGWRHAGRPLDHHTVWVIDGVRADWRDVYDAFGRWDRTRRGTRSHAGAGRRRWTSPDGRSTPRTLPGSPSCSLRSWRLSGGPRRRSSR